ncbi:MAG: acyl-CoA dehydrogenase family protein [Cytophagales bacterium]|nr:acyl-CoA dehydrogenase family protein [Cytophagales bacterium]
MLLNPVLDKEIYTQVAEMTRQFSDEVIRPQAEHLDKEEQFPDAIFKQMSALGLFGITVPEKYGGVGFDNLTYTIVMEELSRGYASVADQCGLVELICTLLIKYGTERQREKYLGKVLKNEVLVSYCITEAEAGSDVSGIKSTATKADDGWVLNGSKMWIHNAPVADIGFVLVRTRPEPGHRGMSIFIVDLNSTGVTRGPRDHKMGQRASQVGSLFFDQVKLPEDALLGELNRGFYIMMSVLEKGRVGIGALAVGIAQAGLNAATEYAKVRSQFGKPVIENQGIQWMLAEMQTEIKASRALVRDAALRLDNNLPAASASSMAKYFASDTAVKQTANAVQIFGGSGYIRGFEVERLYRDAKITQIYEGTNQIQRTIIAKELIKNGPENDGP